MQPQPAIIISCANTLGEGVLWESRSGVIFWTDIEGKRLYRYHWQSRALHSFKLPERLSAFGLVAEEGHLMGAFESGFGMLEVETGLVNWLTRPLAGIAERRLNDGRVDARGRFWCGSMRRGPGQGIDASGTLYCLDVDGRLTSHVEGLKIPNAICWSLDGTRMYLADSPERKIDVFDFEAATGQLSNRRLFAATEADIFPDGAVVDAEGYLWNAQWNGHRVVRYAPDGHIDFILPVPVSQPTCVAFGGPELDHLIITSAREGLSAEQLAAEPLAGSLLIYKCHVKGCPSPLFGPLLSGVSS